MDREFLGTPSNSSHTNTSSQQNISPATTSESDVRLGADRDVRSGNLYGSTFRQQGGDYMYDSSADHNNALRRENVRYDPMYYYQGFNYGPYPSYHSTYPGYYGDWETRSGNADMRSGNFRDYRDVSGQSTDISGNTSSSVFDSSLEQASSSFSTSFSSENPVSESTADNSGENLDKLLSNVNSGSVLKEVKIIEETGGIRKDRKRTSLDTSPVQFNKKAKIKQEKDIEEIMRPPPDLIEIISDSDCETSSPKPSPKPARPKPARPKPPIDVKIKKEPKTGSGGRKNSVNKGKENEAEKIVQEIDDSKASSEDFASSESESDDDQLIHVYVRKADLKEKGFELEGTKNSIEVVKFGSRTSDKGKR